MSQPFAKRAAPSQVKLPTFNSDSIAKAEAAVEALAVEFEDWMVEELDRLLAARAAARRAELDEAHLEILHNIAHDIKGVGATYNFPLATLIAKSLCTLIETPGRRAVARTRPQLIDAHVDAIRALVDKRIRSTSHAIGAELLAELERQVGVLVADVA